MPLSAFLHRAGNLAYRAETWAGAPRELPEVPPNLAAGLELIRDVPLEHLSSERFI
jgi:hypothetical protein